MIVNGASMIFDVIQNGVPVIFNGARRCHKLIMFVSVCRVSGQSVVVTVIFDMMPDFREGAPVTVSGAPNALEERNITPMVLEHSPALAISPSFTAQGGGGGDATPLAIGS